MGEDSSRRQFLASTTLAGAVLAVAGGTGCWPFGHPEPSNNVTGASGGTTPPAPPGPPAPPSVFVDTCGRVVINDKALAGQLSRIWAYQKNQNDPEVEGGIPVVFVRPTDSAANWEPNPPCRRGAAAAESTETPSTEMRAFQAAAGISSSTKVQGASTVIENSPEGYKINSLCKCMPGVD